MPKAVWIESGMLTFVALLASLYPVGFDVFYHYFYLLIDGSSEIFNQPYVILGAPIGRYIIFPEIMSSLPLPKFFGLVLLNYFSWRLVLKEAVVSTSLTTLAGVFVAVYFLVFWTPLTISVGLVLSFLVSRKEQPKKELFLFTSVAFHPLSVVFALLAVLVSAPMNLKSKARGGVAVVLGVMCFWGAASMNAFLQEGSKSAFEVSSVSEQRVYSHEVSKLLEASRRAAEAKKSTLPDRSRAASIAELPSDGQGDVMAEMAKANSDEPIEGTLAPVLLGVGQDDVVSELAKIVTEDSPENTLPESAVAPSQKSIVEENTIGVIRPPKTLGLHSLRLVMTKSKEVLVFSLVLILLRINIGFEIPRLLRDFSIVGSTGLVVFALGSKAMTNGSVLIANLDARLHSGYVDYSIQIAQQVVGNARDNKVQFLDGVGNCVWVYSRFTPSSIGFGASSLCAAFRNKITPLSAVHHMSIDNPELAQAIVDPNLRSYIDESSQGVYFFETINVYLVDYSKPIGIQLLKSSHLEQ